VGCRTELYAHNPGSVYVLSGKTFHAAVMQLLMCAVIVHASRTHLPASTTVLHKGVLHDECS
jgi:hypothetical protein